MIFFSLPERCLAWSVVPTFVQPNPLQVALCKLGVCGCVWGVGVGMRVDMCLVCFGGAYVVCG